MENCLNLMETPLLPDRQRTQVPVRLERLLLMCLVLVLPGCHRVEDNPGESPEQETSLFNLAHLDHLGETVRHDSATLRIIHIYAEAPTYTWVADDDEGIACVDDAARAAVVYLRHFEITGDESSREKAEQLLRFVMRMQRSDGLFYNFVWNNQLDINTAHPNSRADAFGWWAARGVWALGAGARILKEANPALARAAADRIRLALPHVRQVLSRYGQTTQRNGLAVPRWLLYETAADATSEMLLGLVALNKAYPDPEVQVLIERFAEGIARMQYGSMNTFPYGAHASWIEGWHGWGNSQTQALSEAGLTASAEREAEHFYPRLLVEGWRHSFSLDDPGTTRNFEQIAYAVRCVAVGLIRLFEATGEARYAKMAGLAASWFTGNNVADVALYDAENGRGFDGISGPGAVNANAGAESTIEALFTILEVAQHPEAMQWIHARGGPSVSVTKDGQDYLYRVFTVGSGATRRRLGVIMNLTQERLQLLEGAELAAFPSP